MRGEGSKEREERAAEALLAAALLQSTDDDDQLDLELLPELSLAEKTALAGLGADFMSRLLAGDPPTRKTVGRGQRPVGAGPPCAGSESKRGLNRADEVDEAADAEIERKRREITDRKRRDQDGEPAHG